MKNGRPYSLGFTLIELSIAIVIIGLIVAGVVGGGELVTQGKIRSVIVDIDKYVVAINTFRLKYDYYPGDMPNASSYWAGAHNGDGNGITRHTSTSGNCNNYGEHMFSWAHMGSAGILNVAYPYGDTNPLVGIHVPESPFGSYGFAAGFNTWTPTMPAIYVTNVRPNGYYRRCTTYGGGIAGIHTQAIDKKLDDGKRSSGQVHARNGHMSDGATKWTTCESGVDYDLSAPEEPACFLVKMF